MLMSHNYEKLTDQQKRTLKRRFKILMSTNHSVSGVCRQEGISRDTYYRYLNNYVSGGLMCLLDKSRAHHNHLWTKPAELLIEIIGIIRSNPEFGYRRIHRALNMDGVDIRPKTVNNILRKNGLSTVSVRIKYFDMQERESEMYQ